MANMFKCVIAAGSGDGASLIVTCSQNFAGKVITCTDGGEHTYQETCPSSSPYTVTFKSIPVGTYTISGVISGQTFSTTKTITDFSATLNDIPDGATVTPTNDVQILLNCANIWDKSYTTISQLLADTTSLLAVISDNNAVDYLVRSTTWASSVCANRTAMTYIGADDYCADTLLADSTWLNAICGSTYFESVLNVKVPTMTGYNTPSGLVFSTTDRASNNQQAWKCFNNDANYGGSTTYTSNGYFGYDFEQNVTIYKFNVYGNTNATYWKASPKMIKLQSSDDNSSYSDNSDSVQYGGNGVSYITNQSFIATINTGAHRYWRMFFTNNWGDGESTFCKIIQFYGRANS